MQNCLFNMQPFASPHQKGAPRVREVQTRNHEAPSNLSFLPGRFQGSPCHFISPFSGAYRDTGGGSETVGFQFFLPDVIHLILVGLLGSHVWFWKLRAYLKPYELVFFSYGKRTFGCQSDATKIQFMKRDFYMLRGSRSLTTGQGRLHCPQRAGSLFLCKSVTPSESEGWVN